MAKDKVTAERKYAVWLDETYGAGTKADLGDAALAVIKTAWRRRNEFAQRQKSMITKARNDNGVKGRLSDMLLNTLTGRLYRLAFKYQANRDAYVLLGGDVDGGVVRNWRGELDSPSAAMTAAGKQLLEDVYVQYLDVVATTPAVSETDFRVEASKP